MAERLLVEWTSGGPEWTPPGTGQLCNRCVLVVPPHGQLTIRQTHFHHNFPRLLITLPPIPTRLCGWGWQNFQWRERLIFVRLSDYSAQSLIVHLKGVNRLNSHGRMPTGETLPLNQVWNLNLDL